MVPQNGWLEDAISFFSGPPNYPHQNYPPPEAGFFVHVIDNHCPSIKPYKSLISGRGSLDGGS